MECSSAVRLFETLRVDISIVELVLLPIIDAITDPQTTNIPCRHSDDVQLTWISIKVPAEQNILAFNALSTQPPIMASDFSDGAVAAQTLSFWWRLDTSVRCVTQTDVGVGAPVGICIVICTLEGEVFHM